MAHLANIVVVKVDPSVIDRIKPAMLENAHNSVREDGCLQFDVVQSWLTIGPFCRRKSPTACASARRIRRSPSTSRGRRLIDFVDSPWCSGS